MSIHTTALARLSGQPGSPEFARAKAMLDAAAEHDAHMRLLKARIRELELRVEAQAGEIDELVALAVRLGARTADVLEARRHPPRIAPTRR